MELCSIDPAFIKIAYQMLHGLHRLDLQVNIPSTGTLVVWLRNLGVTPPMWSFLVVQLAKHQTDHGRINLSDGSASMTVLDNQWDSFQLSVFVI
jgi:hypothetical protein